MFPVNFLSATSEKRKHFAHERQRSEEEENQQETESNRFLNLSFNVALDNIISAVDNRFQAIANICDEFVAILKIKGLEDDQIHPVAIN